MLEREKNRGHKRTGRRGRRRRLETRQPIVAFVFALEVV
jgi:hypothetical protein